MINITFTTGDIFTSNADILVNPVNTSAISGRGLAKEFAKRYPNNQTYLEDVVDKYQYKGGDIVVFKPNRPNIKYIYNVFTKEDWRKPSQLDWILRGMSNIYDEIRNEIWFSTELNRVQFHREVPKSIAIPKLGCGATTGQLDWNDVKPIIVTAFDTDKDVIDLEVLIYE